MAAKSLILAVALIALSSYLNTCFGGGALDYIQYDLAKATETLNHASDLYKKATDQGQKERLAACISEYKAVTSTILPNAAVGVKAGAFAQAVTELQETQQRADKCEGQFAPPQVSPFTAETKEVKDLAQSAIDSLKNGG